MNFTSASSIRVATTKIAFDNTFERDLAGMYAPVKAATVPTPTLIGLNKALMSELGLPEWVSEPARSTAIFSGNALPQGAASIAQAYSGHQFGGFSPQLGDGRALLLGEVIDTLDKRRDISFKGSGRTPYSRGGDGKATLGPVLREYIMGEAMHALGIATTRALAVVSTGEKVLRDQLLPGAILTRVAASHLRVGSFQYAAAKGDRNLLRSLANYAIARHDPHLSELPAQGKGNRYMAFLSTVCERQAHLIAQWLGVGFIHGVMNTDNMTISGETIDYGPCAFMDRYDPATVFSSIDLHGRYAYANQAPIAQWNLARLAETLMLLIASDKDSEAHALEQAGEIINGFPERHEHYWLATMRNKLGLLSEQPGDLTIAQGLLSAMENQSVDFTSAFLALGEVAGVGGTAANATELLRSEAALSDLFKDATSLRVWLKRWQARCAAEDEALAEGNVHIKRQSLMQQHNPVYIPRNHLVEEALSAAVTQNNMEPFESLLAVVRHPYALRSENATYSLPQAPEKSFGYQTFCGT